METLYVHDEVTHNFRAAKEVLPFIVETFKPISLLDVGCGIGTWLTIAKDLGVKDVVGVDGSYTNRELLKINPSEFIERDLREPFFLNRTFDLAICLEVAEHLPESKAEILINSLCNHSNIIVFSAAIPGQGGQNHINEQWPTYWVNHFAKYGFAVRDILRFKFWNDDNIEFWYRQNMFVFMKDNTTANNPVLHYVHPALFQKKVDYIEFLQDQLLQINERPGLKTSFRLLQKAILQKLGYKS